MANVLADSAPRCALREHRGRAGLSLRELAFFVPCSHTTLARLEKGEIDVSASLKARIARTLEVRLEEIWSPIDYGDDPLQTREPADAGKHGRSREEIDHVESTTLRA